MTPSDYRRRLLSGADGLAAGPPAPSEQRGARR
jgi:hypothetical protein